MPTKDEILGANDTDVIEVDVPGWGTCYVRTISGTDRDYFEQLFTGDKKSPSNVRALFATMCLSDKDGTPLFTRAESVALGRKSAVALEEVFQAGLEHNRMGEFATEGESEGSEKLGSG